MNRQLNKTQSDLVFDILRRYFNDRTIGGKVYNKFNREWTDTTCIAGGKACEVKEKYLDTKLKNWLYARGWLKLPEMEEEVRQIMIARDNDLTELRRKYTCTPHYGGYFGKDIDFSQIVESINELILDGTVRPLTVVVSELKENIDIQRRELINELGFEFLLEN